MYISSDITRISFSFAMTESASNSSLPMTLPHGLFGEFMIISFVFGVIWFLTSLMSILKSLSP